MGSSIDTTKHSAHTTKLINSGYGCYDAACLSVAVGEPLGGQRQPSQHIVLDAVLRESPILLRHTLVSDGFDYFRLGGKPHSPEHLEAVEKWITTN